MKNKMKKNKVKIWSMFLSMILICSVLFNITLSNEVYAQTLSESENTTEESNEKVYLNLLLNGNGDFEQGLTGWTHNGLSTATIITEDNNKYLKLSDNTGGQSLTYQELNFSALEPGDTVIIKARYNLPETFANICNFVMTKFNGTSIVYPSTTIDLNTATDGWQDIYYEYTVPEGITRLRFQIQVRDNSAAEAILYVDDIEVLAEAGEAAQAAAAFRAMLSEEESNSQQVNKNFQTGITTPFQGQPSTILTNGDFNADTNGTGWALGTAGSIVEAAGLDGSNALKICGTGNPVIPQTVPIVGGAEYYVTYKYKVEAEQTVANPSVKLEYFASTTLDGANCVKEEYVHPEVKERDGQWHTVSSWVYPPANANVLRIMPRMLQSAYGEVMFDDVTVTMTQAPFALELVTDQIFYYSNSQTATFSTTVNTNYYPALTNALVDFQVYDGNTLIWEVNDVVSNNGFASTEFNLENLVKMEKPYCVKATIYNADDSVADASTQNIYIYERPDYINEKGQFIKNGVGNFYPALGYHVSYIDSENNDYAKAAEAGVNLIQIYGSTAKEQLDALAEHGLMGVVTLYANMKPAGSEDNIDYTCGILSNPELINHPALFGYILMDEVFLSLSNPSKDMEASYRLIRMFDKKHPIVTMEAMANYYDECAKFVDILFIDPYDTAEGKNAYENTQIALNAVNHQKGIYTVLCTYGSELTWYRAEDIRNNCWQALIAGADAIGYYAISDGVVLSDGTELPLWQCPFDSNEDYTVWDQVVEFGNEEKVIAFDHFVYEKSPSFNQVLGENYWYSSWETDDVLYMVVLGMKENNNLQVSIPLINTDNSKTIGAYTAEIVAGGNGTITGNGSLNITVNGTSAVLYKITPTE